MLEKIVHKLASTDKQQEIAARIFSACSIEDGRIMYNGKQVGWVRKPGIGWMDKKAYAQICQELEDEDAMLSAED